MSAARKQNNAPASDIAKLALPLMAQHGVEPTPENYAVWFEYIKASNKKLKSEIDQMIEGECQFTKEQNEYLHSKYIAEDLDKKIVEQATQEAQLLLVQIMRAIEMVGSNTDDYGEALDDYTKLLEGSQFTHDSIKEVVGNILDRTKSMSAEGKKLSKKLEASSKEVQLLRENLSRATEESQKDFLTGIHNRKAFDEQLETSIKLGMEEQLSFSLVILDIDHFKKFNDDYGHQIGDEVLKQVARALTDTVRGQDFVARYGGEEFVLILPDTPLSGALTVGENLRKTIASKSLRLRGSGKKLRSITISAGVSAYRIGKDSSETLIQRADEALYKSKQGGRNKVTPENMASSSA